MSMFEYKVVNVKCDKCGMLLSEEAGEMYSVREAERYIDVLGWERCGREVFCDECKMR